MDGILLPDERLAVPTPSRRDATRLSRVAPPARAAIARAAALARASLVLGSAVMSTGCLITDPPQFKAAKHTRPFLVEATADPDPRAVVLIQGPPGAPVGGGAYFSADVLSQDDSSGDFARVQSMLYLDYGLRGFAGLPFAVATYGNTLAPGSLDQTGRRVTVPLSLASVDIPQGCHTATLVVTHKPDSLNCPACDDDWSSITWQINRCNGDTCAELPTTGPGSCTGFTFSCAQAQAERLAMDAGVSECSEDPMDGGTP